MHSLQQTFEKYKMVSLVSKTEHSLTLKELSCPLADLQSCPLLRFTAKDLFHGLAQDFRTRRFDLFLAFVSVLELTGLKEILCYASIIV